MRRAPPKLSPVTEEAAPPLAVRLTSTTGTPAAAHSAEKRDDSRVARSTTASTRWRRISSSDGSASMDVPAIGNRSVRRPIASSPSAMACRRPALNPFSSRTVLIATTCERRVVSDRAMAFGRYPSASAARRTLARVPGAALAPSVKVRDTAERDTPAAAATSPMVGGFGGRAPGWSSSRRGMSFVRAAPTRRACPEP